MYLFKQTHLVECLYLGTVCLGYCKIALQDILSILESRGPAPQLQVTGGSGTQEEPRLGALSQIFISLTIYKNQIVRSSTFQERIRLPRADSIQ